MTINDLITLLLANKTITPEMWQTWLDAQSRAGIRTNTTVQIALVCTTIIIIAIIHHWYGI